MNNKQLKDSILKEIAIHFPFSLDDILTVYGTTQSIDNTIRVCESAIEMGISSPVYITQLIRDGMAEPIKAPLFPRIK